MKKTSKNSDYHEGASGRFVTEKFALGNKAITQRVLRKTNPPKGNAMKAANKISKVKGAAPPPIGYRVAQVTNPDIGGLNKRMVLVKNKPDNSSGLPKVVVIPKGKTVEVNVDGTGWTLKLG